MPRYKNLSAMSRPAPSFWSMIGDAEAIHEKTAMCVKHAKLLMGKKEDAAPEKEKDSGELLEEAAKRNADPKKMYSLPLRLFFSY